MIFQETKTAIPTKPARELDIVIHCLMEELGKLPKVERNRLLKSMKEDILQDDENYAVQYSVDLKLMA